MTHAQRRQGMGVGILLLLTPWAPALGQRAEPPPDDAGVVWRLVRGGGGFSSPGGTTGMGLKSVASSGELFVAVGEQGTIVRSSDGNHWSEARFSLPRRISPRSFGEAGVSSQSVALRS